MATTVSLDDIQGLYIAYFNRPADFGGLKFWQNAANAAGGITVVADAFAASPEYTEAYAGKTNFEIVNQIYLNLFGREAEVDGLVFWSNALENGLGVGNVAYQIFKGAQNADLEAVNAKVAAATAFYNSLDTTAEIIGYSGAAANNVVKAWLAGVTDQATLDAATTTTALDAITTATVAAYNNVAGKSYSLTTGIDTIVGTQSNDVFNATPDGSNNTFTALDKLDGGAGIDTLNIVTSTGTLAGSAGATVTNIEIVNITSGNAITAADISSFTGVTNLNVVSGGAISGVKAAATADISVANGLSSVAVDGGKNVTINAAGAVNVGAATAAAGDVKVTTSAAGSVTIKGAGAETANVFSGAINFVNGTTVNATAVNAVSAADRKAHASALTAATTANTAATNDTDATGVAKLAAAGVVTDLGTLATAIAAATNSSADASTGFSIQAATYAALQSGAITAANKIAIDLAFSSAASTAAGRTAALALVTPLQTAATAASNAAIAADAASDATAAAALAAATTVSGADTAAATQSAATSVTATTNTALTSATVKGNYGSTNNITDNSTLHNTLTTVTLENAGNATLTGQAITNVSVTGQSADVNVINTTAAHTQNFTLSGITAGTYTDANATTVKIASTGTATNVLTALTANLATSVVVTGAAGVNFGTLTADAAAVIDASGNSGSNTISLLAGQQYKGGSGVDTVTSNGAATVTVDGGAGTADKLVLSGFDATKASKYLNFEVLSLNSGVSADVSKFTGSTVTSEILNGGTVALTGLTAAQAANITVAASGAYTFGVTGATTVGQLDTVSLNINDGLGATNTIALAGPSLAGVETLNLALSDNLTIDNLLSATALTKVTATGTKDLSIISDALALNVNTIVDASGVSGDVTLNFSAATANGVALKAGDGDNTLTGTNIAGKGNAITTGNGDNSIIGGQADDVIVAGNGANSINAGAGNNTVTVGNGDNHITTGAGTDTITAGNGQNVISAGAGNDIITVGTGSNLITGGAGGDTITFGAHAAGVLDGLVYSAAAETFAGVVTSGSTVLTAIDVVKGLHAGDTINISALGASTAGDTAFVTTLLGAAGTNGDIALVRGTFAAGTGIFTASTSGADTLVQWDSNGTAANGNIESIVLVGTVSAATHSTGGVITL
ncbi:DUF4214 domain-containing protein [Duganella sp. FT109W]|uniref:DUF4214 domain-containing protein n=1 Tax=Duganella margarita TaxID=2692170 RepID=A0ABW9WF54_9BURK|nr:DUF4214 domain-containing protein [Duganella margarita]MYN39734.1 DUF4214 domain-containing protein [Duganella margarita]